MKSTAMRTVSSLIAVALFAQDVQAADEVFDRRAEIEQYIEVFGSGNVTETIAAANRLYVAGISDTRLADVLSARLARDYAELNLEYTRSNEPHPAAGVVHRVLAVDTQYGAAMARALASLGVEQAAATLRQIAQSPRKGGANIKRVRDVAAQQAARIEWYRKRNEIMASTKNHRDGDDPRVSMMVNLLLSDDRSYREHAMDRIYSERLRDPRLFAVLESQVRQYLLDTQAAPPRQKADSLAEYSVKLLGLSGDRSRSEILRNVLASNLPAGIKKQAQVALDRLK